MDYSKFSTDTLQQIASGKDLDYGKLTDDELKEIAGSTPEPQTAAPKEDDSSEQTAKDALTGAGETLGVSQQVAGAAQAVPDAIQSLMHNLGLSGASPTQVNKALASMGIKGDIGPQSSSELYKQGTKDEVQRQNEAVARSPIAYRAGEAGGALAGGLATAGLAPELVAAGKGAPLVAKMAAGAVNSAPVGALYGALNSPGSLIGGTPEEQAEVGQSAKTGAKLGAGLGAGAGLLGSALSKLGGTESAQDLLERFKLGQEGKSLGDKVSQTGTLANPESLATSLSQHDTRTANTLLDGLNSIDEDLGQDVGKSLREATNKGINIKLDPDTTHKMDQLFGHLPDISVSDEGLETAPGEYEEPKFRDLMDYTNKLKTEGLNPTELWKFRQELGNIGNTLKNSNNAQDRFMAAETFRLTDGLGNTLKRNVPDYGQAATRMEQFRRLMPETILSKDNPVDVTQLRMGGTRNVDTKLLNGLKKIVGGLNTGDDVAQGSFTNLLQGMKELNDNEMQRKLAGSIDQTIFDKAGLQPQQIEDYMRQAAQRSKVIQSYTGTDNSAIGKTLGIPKQIAGYAAEKAGQLSNNLSKNPIQNISEKLYTATPETLRNFSDNVLTKIPGQKPLSDALNKALDHKDDVAKNAVLFSIMQNPNLRNLVESNNLDLEPR